jgi:1-acyl-sn-glycerol-3-phosphate acyltransferase
MELFKMKGILGNIRSVVRYTGTISLVAICSILSVPSFLISPSGDLSFQIMKITSKLMLMLGGIKVYIEGLENVDKENAQIFASNHVSAFDIIVLTAISPVKIGWVAKKELFYIPFLGWLMKANGHIAIDRRSGRKALESIKAAAAKVKAGTNIVIFPEGTRSRDGKLIPFKKGVFHLCTRTGVPLVPIYILGTYEVLKPDSLAIQSGNVYVKIGKGIPTSEYPNNRAGELMDDLRTRIIELEKETIKFREQSEVQN